MGAPHVAEDPEVLRIVREAFDHAPVAHVGERVVDVGQPVGGQRRGIDQRVLREQVADDGEPRRLRRGLTRCRGERAHGRDEQGDQPQRRRAWHA
jgi:hypothetical protein